MRDSRCRIQDRKYTEYRMKDAVPHHASSIVHRASCIMNERGIALMMVLVLSVITLAIMAGMVYMITSGTQVSGIQKRYNTALEAGKGGTDVIYQLIGARGDPGIPLENFEVPASNVGGYDCLTDKLNSKTDDWNAVCDNTLTINTNNQSTYDVRFDLGNYRVYSKISDTVEGNSGADEGLLKTGVVLTNPGEIQVQNIPYYYTIEVDAQHTTNPAERAKLSVLYQY